MRGIRKELKTYKRLKKQEEWFPDDFEETWLNGPSTTEEKIYYGSDSDESCASFGLHQRALPSNEQLDEESKKLYQEYMLDRYKRHQEG